MKIGQKVNWLNNHNKKMKDKQRKNTENEFEMQKNVQNRLK